MNGRILAGKYKLLEKLGSGGMADVYKATELSLQHRTVAIKLLKPELGQDAAFLRRFGQEAQAVLKLSHENIVRPYDVGLDRDMPFIVLEYVEGRTLKERISEKDPMTPRHAINLSAQVLDALAHAHDKGIIHRDVKPQNIIINSRGRAKLTDFGIARNTASDTTTLAGANVFGSVHYLSPEQAKGLPVTSASDIYSMGITLYEMVTGKLPFEAESSVSVALKHVQDELIPPIKLNPSLPPALNDIIMKAAAKEPKDRYQSAKAMRLDLMRVLREPSGTFARQAQQKPDIKAKRGVFRIALVAVVMLGLFGALFLAARTVLERRAISSTELVPKLVGKSIEEAKNIAKLRTYTIDIIETVTSSEFPGGVVLEQEPSAGTALKNGSQISVTVSAGAFMPRVPELFGLTLKEAEEALLDAGLVRGDIEYRISDAPVGTVFKQDPAEGTSLFEGDEVQLFISGEPSRNIEMINVTGLSLRRALPLLKEAGFNALRVKLTEAPEAGQEDLVLKQNPAYGESASNANAVELTVSGKLSGLYTADVAFRVDVDEPLTKLLATIPLTLGAVEYERIVYEALLDEGPEQEVSFTAAIGEGGERQMNVYLNNALTRKTAVTFSHTG